MRIRMLGGFSVSVDSRPIEGSAWRLRKAASLVKLLALSPGHRLHREQVMYVLWPDLGRQAASNNLRGVIHATRRALESDSVTDTRYLSLQGEQIALCPEGQLWVDVEAFEEAAAAARRSQERAAYGTAIELYTGELLPEDRYEEWAEEHRQRLRETHLSLLLGLARLHEERREYELAVEVLRRVLLEEPAREEAHAGLMRLLALSGSKGEALAHYERLEEVLLKELGTEPSPSSRALREEIAAGRFPPKEAPAPGSPLEEPPDATKHNLPAPRTSFVGREREMVEVKRSLAMSRLLTLTGSGGSGKTRLALEMARDLIGIYPDGVWLVELAALTEEELVTQAAAEALGVREVPGRSLTDTLVDALKTKQMLLVLDNCEHLIDACARLVDTLLGSCPRLRILATSREPLGVEGEIIWRVSSMSMPDSDRLPAAGELTRYDAVRLFLNRARLRLPDFDLTSANASAVAEVCRKLEGMPLAIELATARMGALAVEEVAQRLEDSLGFLTAGPRVVAPRQRTMRATLEWSYGLLSEPERVLFRRISVFAGRWTLKAAEEIGSDGIEKRDVLDLLSRLIDKSLVVAEVTQGSPIRYRMLEPIRQYARERLDESGEAETVLRRHAVFFLTLAEEAEVEIEGAQQAAWLDLLETEHDNMRAALSWSLGQGDDAELGLRMGAALGEFWYLRGYLSEGRKWLEEALAKSGQASTATRARALHRVAWLALLLGDLDQSENASEEGIGLEDVELFRTRGYDSVAAELQRTLGIALEIRGQFERAMELFEESLALSREVGSVRGTSISLFGEGVVSRAQGDLERATDLLEEALTLCRESGDPALLASILTHLGYTFVLQGDLERATAVSEEAAAMLREQKHRAYLADALNNLGWVAVLRGDSEQAKSLFAESLRLRLELGDKQAAPETLLGLACAATRGEAGRATKLFGTVEAMREMIGIQPESAERALQEPYLAAARRQQSEAGWEKAWEEGKSMSFEEAIEYALCGEETATPAPTALERPSPRTQQPDLTRREEEVASLVAQGLTNRQIATELSISEHTVATHVGKIMRKLGFSSRSQLAAWVTEQGLPTSDSG